MDDISVSELLGQIDDDRDEPDPLDEIRPFIRFDWNSAPAAPWLAQQHPATAEPWSITLQSGRSISLREFHQFNIYAGMLAGIPSDTVRFAAEALKEAKRVVSPNLLTLMLQPLFREFEYQRHRESPAAQLRALPPIASVAEFSSSAFESNPEQIVSSLTVIWFQEGWGLPTDQHVLGQLRAMDWEREAQGYDP